MFTPSIRACLLVCVAALAASVGSGQQPDAKKGAKAEEPPPPYTAFPDLRPRTSERKEVKKPDGTVEIVIEEKDAVPLPPWPEVAADAPPLRKLQSERLLEGHAALEAGAETMRSFLDFIDKTQLALDVYRVAAELEEKPAKRVPWYEVRVRRVKEFERFIELKVRNGSASPEHLYQVRFLRLEAEAELLKLKAEVEKGCK